MSDEVIMNHERPIEEQTVKALSWQMLYGNYYPKLGRDGWTRLAEQVEAPDFRKMDQDEDCPMEPFNQAVQIIDREIGRGDGAMIEEITVASVERWGSMFRNLVAQLQGRPQKMMEIFCNEVHPYFLNDPAASAVVESEEEHFALRMDNGLLEGFKVGLIKGFCDIVGADASIERRNGEYHVTWKIREETPEPSRWAKFVNATRLPFLTATIVPVLLGTAIAWTDGFLNLGLFALTLLGAAFFHLGTNVMNDYFDHNSGADEANLTPTPFAGGSRLIQRGLISANTTRNLAWSFFAAGTALGLVLSWLRGWELLIFGLLGFLLGYLYTAPPMRLVYRGLGEIAVGLGFGPIMVLGAYWVQAGAWSNEALLASIPVGLLIAAVLYINEISDRIWDARAGKRTLVTHLTIPASLTGYAVLMAVSYLAVLVGVIVGAFPATTLLGLLTVPMAWSAFRTLRRHHAFPYRLIPANATTVFTHFFTGLLLVLGYVVAGIIPEV
jgi:1,4-dihydroxy-2-naphthoate octaprenyltransferase